MCLQASANFQIRQPLQLGQVLSWGVLCGFSGEVPDSAVISAESEYMEWKRLTPEETISAFGGFPRALNAIQWKAENARLHVRTTDNLQRTTDFKQAVVRRVGAAGVVPTARARCIRRPTIRVGCAARDAGSLRDEGNSDANRSFCADRVWMR
jgi:hypothetical protein